MKKMILPLLLASSSSAFAHETDYTHFHDDTPDVSNTQGSEVSAQTPINASQDFVAYGGVDLHRVTRFKAKGALASVNFAEPGAIRVFGGVELNDYLGLEVGAIRFGESDTFTNNGSTLLRTDTNTRGLTVGARFTLPLTEAFKLVSTAGYFSWHSKTRSRLSYPSFPDRSASKSFHEHGGDLYWGAGVEYALDPQLLIGLNYNKFKQSDIFNSSTPHVDLEQSTIALSLRIKL